jgi:type IV pilus assembly protein PilA
MVVGLKIKLVFLLILLFSAGYLVIHLLSTNQLAKPSNVSRARLEGSTYVGAINRMQQASRIDNDKFTESLAELDKGFPSETKNYIYVSKLITPTRVQNVGIPKVDGLTPFVGGVTYTKVQEENLTLATLCYTDQPSKTEPPNMIFKEGKSPICPEGYYELS